METIKFRIIPISDDMCIVAANDLRDIYKNIADGGCITSLDVMIAEMRHIKEEVEKLGNEVVFIFD